MNDGNDAGGPPAAGPGEVEASRTLNGGDVVFSMRPVFLGNLMPNYTPEDVRHIFEQPLAPPRSTAEYKSIPVERVDLKRGYCFVFLVPAPTEEDKLQAERFVQDINGMEVRNVSRAIRAEFARGDGRVKRKEDDRRKIIQPSETLFVVNFHEETTRREDLRMLFEPFGELLRIDMKRNYAFIQFRTVEEATRAKDEVNGGKLDQSVLTVEYVANHGRRGDDRRFRDGGDGGYRDRRRDDYRGGGGGPGPGRYRNDDYRRRSPPRYNGGGGGGGGGGGYRRSRSRSRSPPRHYRSRSPHRGRDHHDGERRRSPERDAYRRRSPDRDYDRGDRGYRT